MENTVMDNIVDFEQALLSHVEMCYSVALALIGDRDQALALSEETLLWAWRLHDTPWNNRTLKSILLSELRDRYIRRYRVVRNRPACLALPLLEVGA